MTCLSDLIHEMERYGVPIERANMIAAELIAIGVDSAPIRTETKFECLRVERERLARAERLDTFEPIGRAALRVVDNLQPKKAAE